MYGKKRIVLTNREVPTAHGCKVVALKGGKSSAPIGIWYRALHDGLFYADLRSEGQEFKTVPARDLAIKGFGGCATQKQLRDMISAARGV